MYNHKILPWIPVIGIVLVFYSGITGNDPLYNLPHENNLQRLHFWGSAVFQVISIYVVFNFFLK